MSRDRVPTVEKYAAHYLKTYAGPPYHPEKNRVQATCILRNYVLPALGALRLDEVTPRHLAELQAALFARGLGFHTVQGAIFSAWGALWKAARTEGLVVGKPHGGLLWPRHDLNPDPFTEDERNRIVDWFECEAMDVLPIVACVFLAGMRPSEACGLRWQDIDLRTGDVVLERAIASGEVTAGKTRNSRRSLRVGKALRGILKACRPSWAEPGDLIARNVRGNPVNSQWVGTYWFRKCCTALGLRYRGFYHGRHTYVSLALRDGAPIAHVAKFCGTSVQTIERHYWRWVGVLADPAEGGDDEKGDHRSKVRGALAHGRQAGRPKAPRRAP